MDDVTRDTQDDAHPYGVDTIRLRISFPAAPALRGDNDGMWRMQPLRGWTGGQAADAEPPAGAEQDGGSVPDGAGWGGAGGGVAIPVSDRIPASSNEPATPGNPNAKVDALWAERAALTAEMDRLNAGDDYGRAAAELYQRLENRRDIIDADLRSQFNGSLSGTGLQEPGDLEAWLREQAEQASGQPGAYDRMSAEEQRRFIRTHAPDYEIARADEMARRYGEAASGAIGRVFSELGVGALGAVGGAVLGTRAFRGDARVGAGGSRGVPAEVGNGGAPALKGDPYHPESVEARIKPPYQANPAHKPGFNFDFNKTPEPPDAQSVYNRSLLGGIGTWYGRSSNGVYYQFYFDRSGVVHFAGTVREEKIPLETLKALK